MPRSMKAAISTTMNSRTFSRRYIAKLAFKVEHQALQEADRTKLEERIRFRFAPILLKKSFLSHLRKFPGPPVRLVR
jgi:retron-type reverse transcriptase